MDRLPPSRSFESPSRGNSNSGGAPSSELRSWAEFTQGSRDIRKAYTLPQHVMYLGNTSSNLSDSIYMDLEKNMPEPKKASQSVEGSSRFFSHGLPANLPEPILREEMESVPHHHHNTSSYSHRSMEHPRGPQYHSYQSSSKYSTASLQRQPVQPTPVLFGDPFDNGSIMTGLSQQELLRKKARADNKYKKGKKKRMERIINMPALLGGQRATSKYYDARIVANSKEGTKIAVSKKTQISTVQTVLGKNQLSWGSHHVVSRTSEDLDISTAESTRSTENAEIDLPYSTVPAQNAIVNEADGATMLEEWAIRTNLDLQSLGEDSFPILSNHPASFSLLGDEVEERPVRISVGSSVQENSMSDRQVRFSRQVSVEKLAYDPQDSFPEIPWDERADASSVAIEVIAGDGQMLGNSPTTSTSFKTSNDLGQPKSILRPSRFSQNTARFTNAANSLGRRIGDGIDHTPPNGLNTSISRSPPRSGTGFLDHGVELSPIQRAGAEKKGSRTAFEDIMRQANCIYPIGNVVEDGSLYSDPTLDIMQREDDSTVMSTIVFIKTVASIVIQTAYRRHKAMRHFERLVEATDRQMHHVQRTAPKARAASTLMIPATDDYEAMAARLYVLAAIRIQSVFRGFWVRDCLSIDHYCAKVIQQAFRGHRCREQYDVDLHRIVMVQSVWRRNIARVMVADRLWRIIKAQAVSRGYLARKKVRQFRNKKPTARSYKPPKPVPKSSSHPLVPVRTKVALKKDPRKLAIENFAATIIQAEWRCFVCQSDFIRSLVDVLIAQSVVRRWLACRRVRQLRQKKTVGRPVAEKCKEKQRSAPKPSRGFMTKPPRNMYTVRNVSKAPRGEAITHNLSGIEPVQKQSSAHSIPVVSPVSDIERRQGFDAPEDEISPIAGGTKSILSLWKEREQKALATSK